MPNLTRNLTRSARVAGHVVRRVVGWIGHVAFEIVVFVLSTVFFAALVGLFGVPAALGALVAIILSAIVFFVIARDRRPAP